MLGELEEDGTQKMSMRAQRDDMLMEEEPRERNLERTSMKGKREEEGTQKPSIREEGVGESEACPTGPQNPTTTWERIDSRPGLCSNPVPLLSPKRRKVDPCFCRRLKQFLVSHGLLLLSFLDSPSDVSCKTILYHL